MIDRRSFLASTAPLLAMPAASLTAMPAKPLGATTALRAALDAYVDAYRAFFGVPLEALPDDNDGSPESVAIWQGWLDRCRAWRSTRKSLAALVLEHAALNSPPTILAAMVDLGDVLILVTGDSGYEGTFGERLHANRERVACAQVAGHEIHDQRAALLDGTDLGDDTYHHEWYYESRLEDPFTSEEREKAATERAERESRPTRDEVITAVSEAHAADEAILASNKDKSTDDKTLEALVSRQDECWERVRDLTRRYAGLPEDFTDLAVKVGDYVVTIAGNRNYEMPDSVQTAGVDVWRTK